MWAVLWDSVTATNQTASAWEAAAYYQVVCVATLRAVMFKHVHEICPAYVECARIQLHPRNARLSTYVICSIETV